MEKDKIGVREAKLGDTEEICSLYYREFNSIRNSKDWQWEFEDGPFGKAIIVVAENNEKIIGTRTQILVPLSHKSVEFLSGKGEQSIISEEYRGRKIFPLLCNKCADLAVTRNIKALWGFSYAEKAFLNSGWAVPGKINHLILVLHANQAYQSFERSVFDKHNNKLALKSGWKLLFRMFLAGSQLWTTLRWRKIPENNKYKVEAISRVDERIDSFWKKYQNQANYYTIARTAEFLNWRIFKNPNLDYKFLIATENNEIKGYIILGKNKHEKLGLLTDLCVLDGYDEVADLLLVHAFSYFQSESIAVVDAWRMGKNPQTKKYSRQLGKIGFVCLPVGSPFVLKILDKETLPVNPEDLNNWFVTELFSEGLG